MNRSFTLLGICMLLGLSACIKDDFINDTVDPVLRIISTVDTIAINTSFQFEAMYLNNVGVEENVDVLWSSSEPQIISVSESGLAEGIEEGSAIIEVSYDNGQQILTDLIEVVVGSETVIASEEKSGRVETTSSYALSGDFTLSADGNDLVLTFAEDYNASTALPGLYVYLSNNRNTTANALEIGAVNVFSGAHTYTIQNVGINDYSYVLYFCKPFNVKVGDGEIL